MTGWSITLWTAVFLFAWFAWNVLSYLTTAPDYGAVEGVEELRVTLSIAADDSLTLEEDYLLRTEHDEQKPFAGVARLVRLPSGTNPKFDCTGTLNGQPVKIRRSLYRDAAVLVPESTPVPSTGQGRFRLACKVSGLIQREGFERRLELPLTDTRFAVSIERLTAQVFFLFAPRDDAVGMPRLRATLRQPDGGTKELLVLKERGNLFRTEISTRHQPGSEVLLIATWRPPSTDQISN